MFKASRNLSAQLSWVFTALIFLSGLAASKAAETAIADEFISKISLSSSGPMGNANFTTAEGDFPTFNAAPKESFQIALTVPKAIVGKAIQIRADDGGVLKGGKDGKFSATLEEVDGLLKFDYFPGGTTGRYTLKIIAPGYMQVLEFWVGTPRPQASPSIVRSANVKESPKP